MILRSDLVHATRVRRSPSRTVAFRAPSPVPWAYGDHSRISLGPREEVFRVLRAHFVITIVVTHIRSIWVMIDVAAKRPWHEHHLLRVGEVWVDVSLIPRLHCGLRPSSDWPVHVVQIDAEPVDCCWDFKVGDRLSCSVVPSIARAAEECGLVGPDHCRTPRKGSTHSARIFDVVLPRSDGHSQFQTKCGQHRLHLPMALPRPTPTRRPVRIR